jgi:ATP-dependent Lhr-like helicase
MSRVKSALDEWLGCDIVKEIRVAEDNRTLYISADEINKVMEKRKVDNPLRILTLYDPFVQHYRFELRRRFGDAWYFPIFQGSKLVGTMEMWEMSGCMDIRDLTLEDVDLLPDLLDSLDDFASFYEENYMDVIRIKGVFGKSVNELEGKFKKLFKQKGYTSVNDWLVKGNVLTFNVNKKNLFSYLLWKQHVLPERNFEGMEKGLETMSGFRSDEEAFLRCGRTVPLKRLHKTGIVEMGQLIPKLVTYALPDDILLFKAALRTETDEYMKILMTMFKEEGVMKWREVLEKSPLGYRNTLAVKAKLSSGLIILRDSSNRFYMTGDTPYSRSEARKVVIRKMFDQFGIFSAEFLGLYTKGEFRMPEIRRFLKVLEDEGVLAKGYLLEGSDKLHWMVKEDVDQIQAEPVNSEVLVTSNDRLAMYLLPWVREKFGTGTSWILLSNGEIISAAKVRKKKQELFVGEVIGDERVKDAIKDYSIKVGKRLRQAEVPESEDYQEWYEKHMLPQK